jgi:hypothetical protein
MRNILFFGHLMDFRISTKRENHYFQGEKKRKMAMKGTGSANQWIFKERITVSSENDCRKFF